MTQTTAPSIPAGVSVDDIQSDTPELIPLLTTRPDLHIYTKSSPHFEDVRVTFNKEVTAIPRAIVRPNDENELVSTVTFCAKNEFPMSVRSGGHDPCGRGIIADGIVIDLRAFTEIKVVDGNENGSPYFIAGTGVTTGDLLRFLDEKNLVTPTGWCDEVSYTGWAAGGGYGSMTGYYGMGADQILGARLLTPVGLIVDTDDDPELLWALRGAGLGNFGIILELRAKVYPRPQVLAGILAYPLSEAASVFENFEKLCEDLPAAFSGEVLFSDLGAGTSVVFYYHWVYDDENRDQGAAFLGKMKALGNTLLLDTLAESTPYDFVKMMAPNYRFRSSLKNQAVAVANFSPKLIDVLLEHPPSGTIGVVFHHGHGKAIVPNPGAAFPIRKRHLILGITGRAASDTDPEAKKAAYNWAALVNREIRERGLALEQGYWSFTPPEFCDAVGFFGEDSVRRMAKLKERYNPGNAFPQAFPTLSEVQ
ncbi:related to FAD/FMN-containing dehydrogenases [Cephalotrichum gorgonifer]|uniref:Related to FAD/FMN-containing dehydrogenases n=1 Tax=Cephalotrichum gorgonifer TaxID=2041049 RepID=A0AAE8SUQ8_9PEZI|nr:related to FAD/FMN-containing dehydrogenases [Cephalotrichum gorgonifer]